jgi:hypothetical protein
MVFGCEVKMISGADLNTALRTLPSRTLHTGGGPVPQPATSQNNLRFGWRRDTHRVIDVGAEHLLPANTNPEKALKKFLTWNRTEIKLYNDMQDYCSPQNNRKWASSTWTKKPGSG